MEENGHVNLKIKTPFFEFHSREHLKQVPDSVNTDPDDQIHWVVLSIHSYLSWALQAGVQFNLGAYTHFHLIFQTRILHTTPSVHKFLYPNYNLAKAHLAPQGFQLLLKVLNFLNGFILLLVDLRMCSARPSPVRELQRRGSGRGSLGAALQDMCIWWTENS